MAEETLVGGDANSGALDLTLARLAAQLPRQLTYLSERLRRHRLTEASQTAARIDGNAAPDGRLTGPQQLLGLAALAQPEVFDPVEFERSGQVVDLGDVDVGWVDAGFFVGGDTDRFLERVLRLPDD